MNEIDRKFKKEGDSVIVKQTVKDTKLSPKDVLDSIESLEKSKEQLNTNLSNLDKQKSTVIEQLEQLSISIKDLAKFKDWAQEIQESKLKALIDEVKDSCLHKLDDYVYDKTLTKEQNNLQKYRMYREYILRDEKIVGEINTTIIKIKIFEKNLIENPYK